MSLFGHISKSDTSLLLFISLRIYVVDNQTQGVVIPAAASLLLQQRDEDIRSTPAPAGLY